MGLVLAFLVGVALTLVLTSVVNSARDRLLIEYREENQRLRSRGPQ